MLGFENFVVVPLMPHWSDGGLYWDVVLSRLNE